MEIRYELTWSAAEVGRHPGRSEVVHKSVEKLLVERLAVQFSKKLARDLSDENALATLLILLAGEFQISKIMKSTCQS